MATLGEILNLVNCGAGNVLGTGLKGCKPFFKKATSIWLTTQGFKFDSSQTLNEEYIQTLQSQGKLIVLNGIRTFTDNTPDDTIDELEDGTKQIARLGLYEFSLQFMNGMYFDTAINSLNSYGNYDVTFIDREGSILGTKHLDGSLKGFTLGMFQKTKFSWATDSQAEREGIMFQMLERTEFDDDKVYIQNKQLDFNPNKVGGVNELVVDFAAVPVNLDTTVSVKVVNKMDNKPFSGLVFGNFLLKKNGATSNPTASTEPTPGTYSLTVSSLATNDVLEISVYDNVNNRAVIKLDTDLYKSNTDTVTVV